MSGNPASNMHADGRHFSLRSVHAGETFNTKGVNVEICHGAQQHLFQIAYISVHVFPVRTEVYEWIPDSLAQPMISDFSPAIGLKKVHASRSKLLGVKQYSRAVTTSAD